MLEGEDSTVERSGGRQINFLPLLEKQMCAPYQITNENDQEFHQDWIQSVFTGSPPKLFALAITPRVSASLALQEPKTDDVLADM